jgi:hypothetical protein
MKCRACAAQTVCIARLAPWKAFVARCLLVRPVQCRHCFHLFFVPFWLAEVPPRRIERLPIESGDGRETYRHRRAA